MKKAFQKSSLLRVARGSCGYCTTFPPTPTHAISTSEQVPTIIRSQHNLFDYSCISSTKLKLGSNTTVDVPQILIGMSMFRWVGSRESLSIATLTLSSGKQPSSTF